MKLHLGCGKKILDGYVNIDCAYTSQEISQENYIQADAVGYLEGLEDNSIDEIKSEHFLEHLSRTQVSRFLYHSSRVLKDNAIFDVLIPYFTEKTWDDLKNRYLDVNQDAKLGYTVLYGDNEPDSWPEAHKIIYDQPLLKHVLSVYGFNVQEVIPIDEKWFIEIRMIARKTHKERKFVPYDVVGIDPSVISNVMLEGHRDKYHIREIINKSPTSFSNNAVLYRTWFGIRMMDNQLVAMYDSDYYNDSSKIPETDSVSLIPFVVTGGLHGTLSFDFSKLDHIQHNFSQGLCLVRR